jgi:hypothetical protein
VGDARPAEVAQGSDGRTRWLTSEARRDDAETVQDLLVVLGKSTLFAYERYQDMKTDAALTRLQAAVDSHGARLEHLEAQVERHSSAGLRIGLSALRDAMSEDTPQGERDRCIERAGENFTQAAHSSADEATQIACALLCATTRLMRGRSLDAIHWAETACEWADAALQQAMEDYPVPVTPRGGLVGWVDEVAGRAPDPDKTVRRQKDHYLRAERIAHLRSVARAYAAALRGEPPLPESRMLPDSSDSDYGEPTLFEVLNPGARLTAGTADLSVTSAFYRPSEQPTGDFFVRFKVHREGYVDDERLGLAAEDGLSGRPWVSAGELLHLQPPRATVRFEVEQRPPRRLAVVSWASTGQTVWVPITRWRTMKPDYPPPADVANSWVPPSPEPAPTSNWDPGDDAWEEYNQWFRH